MMMNRCVDSKQLECNRDRRKQLKRSTRAKSSFCRTSNRNNLSNRISKQIARCLLSQPTMTTIYENIAKHLARELQQQTNHSNGGRSSGESLLLTSRTSRVKSRASSRNNKLVQLLRDNGDLMSIESLLSGDINNNHNNSSRRYLNELSQAKNLNRNLIYQLRLQQLKTNSNPYLTTNGGADLFDFSSPSSTSYSPQKRIKQIAPKILPKTAAVNIKAHLDDAHDDDAELQTVPKTNKLLMSANGELCYEEELVDDFMANSCGSHRSSAFDIDEELAGLHFH